MRLSVIVPVFNEAETVAAVVESLQETPLNLEIVLVDDASSDGTGEIVDRIASANVKVLHHKVNLGKGAAIRSGLQTATGDVAVIQDADLEYDPEDLIRLIEPIEQGREDVVYGVRSLRGQRLIMSVGNRLLTFITNLIYGARLRDMETCYKMMRRDIALTLGLESCRFEVEVEITAKLLRAGYRICEMAISYRPRHHNKKLSPLDGLPALRALWKYRAWKPSAQLE
jgi:dolichol-phosphate mannosyltransferase